MITKLKYGNTNTYLVRGSKGSILFDTAWAGTFEAFCNALGEQHIKAKDITYLFISHFHPDHMGIAQQIADLGITIVVFDVQRDFIHESDKIFEKECNRFFKPIDDNNIIILSFDESREFLSRVGIQGECIYTPGHSDDSISLWLDDGSLLVGDLNPIYELEVHEGTIKDSWEQLLQLKPQIIYYGHAKTSVMNGAEPIKHENGAIYGAEPVKQESETNFNKEQYRLVSNIMKYIDRGYDIGKIQRKTRADSTFIEDVMRMYLTHQNVGVQGILDRIEIKNK